MHEERRRAFLHDASFSCVLHSSSNNRHPQQHIHLNHTCTHIHKHNSLHTRSFFTFFSYPSHPCLPDIIDQALKMTTNPTRRYLVLITGASRGFGKSLALEVARKWGPQYALDMHLIARSQSGLLATQQEVEKASHTHTNKDNNKDHLRIWTWPIDLGDLKTLPSKLEPVFTQVKASPSSSYTKAYLFNNAGLVGPIGYAQDLAHDLPALQQSINLNLISFIYLTSLFLKHFGAPRQDLPSSASSASSSISTSSSSSSVIVNVSSLAAVQSFESWGVYCAGKAARDMFTQVVAQEQQQPPQPQPQTGTASASAPIPQASQSPLVKTLNYAPGPLDTDMQTELRESKDIHRPTRDWSMEAFKEGKLVRPEASAAKCLEILTRDIFKSGAHIDYYDEIQERLDREKA